MHKHIARKLNQCSFDFTTKRGKNKFNIDNYQQSIFLFGHKVCKWWSFVKVDCTFELPSKTYAGDIPNLENIDIVQKMKYPFNRITIEISLARHWQCYLQCWMHVGISLSPYQTLLLMIQCNPKLPIKREKHLKHLGPIP